MNIDEYKLSNPIDDGGGSDRLEEPTCVKHINITETPSMNVKLNGLELEYLINLMTKDIYKMMDNNVSFENGFIDKLNSKLIVLTKTK